MPFDPFSRTFFVNESIMEIMMSNDAPWDEHHHSSFPYTIEYNINGVYLPNFVEAFTNSIFIHDIDSENNLLNIEGTIPLDIYIKLGIIKYLYIGSSCTSHKINIYQAIFCELQVIFLSFRHYNIQLNLHKCVF